MSIIRKLKRLQKINRSLSLKSENLPAGHSACRSPALRDVYLPCLAADGTISSGLGMGARSYLEKCPDRTAFFGD